MFYFGKKRGLGEGPLVLNIIQGVTQGFTRGFTKEFTEDFTKDFTKDLSNDFAKEFTKEFNKNLSRATRGCASARCEPNFQNLWGKSLNPVARLEGSQAPDSSSIQGF